MNNFNPIIINTAYVAGYNALNQQLQNEGNAVNNSNVQNAQNAQEQANPAQQAQNSPLNTNNTLLSNINRAPLSTVEIEQQANYIKELLSLPKDFQDLITQIQTNNLNSDLKQLLVNGKINLTALTSLLGENSKDAVQKLIMTMMNVSKMGANVAQLKEIMGMISQNGTSDNIQAMKNLLMLYLPYLPMSIRNEMNLDFNIDIFDKIQGPDPNKEESGETLKILIQTANYGNILATLDLAPNNDIDVFIQAGEDFPEKEVMKIFNEENKKSNIKSNVSVEKKDNKNGAELNQNIKIISSDYVSPKLLLAGHSLIRAIIDVDSSEFIINEE